MKIYYHNDLDGRCAGAIALRYAANDGNPPETIELDYKDPVHTELILPGERIIVVDFSFKPEIMEKVFEQTTDVIWIDHHKTARDYKYSKNIMNLYSEGFSGAELTWMYFKPSSSTPKAIILIGDRDTWTWKYGQDTANFCEGIKLHDVNPQSRIWDLLFDNKSLANNAISQIQNDGAICLKYRDMICADYLKSYGFETEFEGYRALALGLYMFGSTAFGKKIKEYPLCLSFEFDGRNYTVGLYSEMVDVSEIAKKWGGGGHKGAAGFVIDSLPFEKK